MDKIKELLDTMYPDWRYIDDEGTEWKIGDRVTWEEPIGGGEYVRAVGTIYGHDHNMKLPNVATVTVGHVEDGVVWHVQVVVDADGHLNIYIENEDGTEIEEVETTQGDGDGKPLALRFTTRGLEERYLASENTNR